MTGDGSFGGGDNKDAGKDTGLGGLTGDGGLGSNDNKDAGKDTGLGGLTGDGSLGGGDNKDAGKDAGLGGLNGDGVLGSNDNKDAGKDTANAFPEVKPENTNTDSKETANAALPIPGNTNTDANTNGNPTLSYYEQAFSSAAPAPYDFPALKAQCARTQWREDDVYLQCMGMAAGLTSIMSQVKVCMKMAFDAGTGLVLPSMPLRDSSNLDNFNFLNQDAYMPYGEWFDAAHLIDSVKRVCPQMRIIQPAQLDTPEYPVKNKWTINLKDAPGYRQFASYFWTGRPFKAFFDEQYKRLAQLDTLNPHNKDKDAPKTGLITISMTSNFLLFRITDDPTGHDRRVWNDLSHLIRFTQPTRDLVAALMGHITRPFYGVHFRVEKDTIWSSLEHQLGVDLDALDKAWEMYGTPGEKKPLVYLACGDQGQVAKFVEAGKERGWEVTHKWTLAAGDDATLAKIDALPFDFQGAVDMAFMVKSEFFLGITGSAFSSTIGNARDVTGRYRGSSLLLGKDMDEGARTHLFNDGDASHYACCL